jgi:hypothetical protein
MGSFQKEATMGDDDKKDPTVAPAVGALNDLMHTIQRAREMNLPPPASSRKKRRRKGQLNDGQWAPGYGPDAKKKPKP